jgi:mRNA interferase MazF
MAINFYPRAGQMFMCDFSGFKVPEMVKPRPVIIVSPRLPHRSDIVAVVPTSTTAPKYEYPFCYLLSKNYHPGEPDDIPVWAKADMVMNLGLYRLTCFKIGRRKYHYPTLTKEDLQGVKMAVLWGLGFGDLIPGEKGAI